MAHQKASPGRHGHDGMTRPRARDVPGRLRLKRGDTLVGAIEARYGVDFHCRSDMRLNTLRKEVGLTSIRELVEAARHVTE